MTFAIITPALIVAHTNVSVLGSDDILGLRMLPLCTCIGFGARVCQWGEDWSLFENGVK
jgi:hypothetical protein